MIVNDASSEIRNRNEVVGFSVTDMTILVWVAVTGQCCDCGPKNRRHNGLQGAVHKSPAYFTDMHDPRLHPPMCRHTTQSVIDSPSLAFTFSVGSTIVTSQSST
jgi:hypothetical protein